MQAAEEMPDDAEAATNDDDGPSQDFEAERDRSVEMKTLKTNAQSHNGYPSSGPPRSELSQPLAKPSDSISSDQSESGWQHASGASGLSSGSEKAAAPPPKRQAPGRTLSSAESLLEPD